MREAVAKHAEAEPQIRVRTTLEAFLGTLARFPRRVADAARGDRRRRPARHGAARPRARHHRAPTSRSSTARTPSAAARRGWPPPLDAYAITGAVVELASRQIRTGVPGDIRELEPIVERLILGLLAAGERRERPRGARAARSPTAAAVRGWSSGASRWRARSARRSATGTTGAGRCPGFGDPARARAAARARARRPRRQPHRADVHRRPVGDFLYAALHRPGFANQPTSEHRDDGLELTDCFITAAVRCAPPANKPLPSERDNCRPWLDAELALLDQARVIVCLGKFAWDVIAPAAAAEVRPRGRGSRRAATRCSAASTRASRTRSPAS